MSRVDVPGAEHAPERRALIAALDELRLAVEFMPRPGVLPGLMARVQAAMDALGLATETYCSDPQPVHGWFGLTYAAWLVLPRLYLEAMPEDWQRKFVVLLKELGATFDDWEPEGTEIVVQLKGERGWLVAPPSWVTEYRHGSAEHVRKKGEGES
jgi:hypothetical protein